MANQSAENRNPEQTQSRQGRKVTPTVVVLAIILIICLAGGIAGGFYLVNTYSQIKDVENSQALEPALPESDKGDGKPQASPIDFASLQDQNPDIYAWIYVPGTDINFPVCQSPDDGAHYLTHNASGEESQLGAIFTEAQFNGKDFQDPVTILYGHNGFGNTMFTALHQFEGSEFFKAHDTFYIYVPGHIYTYKVKSAFMSDGSHLMGSFNFQTDGGMAQFLNYIEDPGAMGAMVSDVATSADDKFVVLSTCNTGALESAGRYLVCGVMADDQPTE